MKQIVGKHPVCLKSKKTQANKHPNTIIKFKGWKMKLNQIKLLCISCDPRFSVKTTGKILWPVFYTKTVWRNIKSLLFPLCPLPHTQHWINIGYFNRIHHISKTVNGSFFIQVFKLSSTWVSTLQKTVQATWFVWAKIQWKSRFKIPHSLHHG